MKDKLTFIYSRRVNRFLIDRCGLVPITEAINPNTGKTFNLYEKTSALQTGLKQYKAQQSSAN